MKTIMFAIMLMLLMVGGGYAANGEGGEGQTSTKSESVINPETGKLRSAVVISEGSSSTITKTIEAP